MRSQAEGDRLFCSQCGSGIKEGMRFCTKCGTPVDAACPGCGRPIEPDTIFCGYCGTNVTGQAPAPGTTTQTTSQPHPQAPGAERRLVSVMFADLVGFTTHSEGRDPEEVRELLSEYFERARDVVGLYGGVIEKFIGDAVMAVWGTPVALEDDTERSVRAALELLDAVEALGRKRGVPLKARAGVHTGEAAVTLGAEGQGMVAGDTVNTASRLQSVAEPGTVLVDRASYLGARDAIAFQEEGSVALKGKGEAVESWRALRVIGGRKGDRTRDALEPLFTGRDEELRQIKDLLHATTREGKARLASVIGIAGIGKSRLVWELYKHIDGLSDTIFWHEGRSPAYGDGIAFWSLAEMVRMRTRIAETDELAEAESKLDATLDRFFPDTAEHDWLKPALRHLLGLEESDEPAEKLFAAWRRFFEGIAESGTTVMVFEDLHWADPGLITFIEQMVEWSRSRPILIVTMSRPELRERHPAWGAGARSFTSIHLEPLTDEDMTILLKGLVPDLPGTMTDEIVARAEGVPLYAVEMVRMLIDRGQLEGQGREFRWVGREERLEVPDSLHSLIASRLDALPGEDRLLVQDASVLGKTFTVDSLESLSEMPRDSLEQRLRELVRREILVLEDDPRSPERGQYGFVQSLIREIAYQTLSMADRKSRHLKAARYFESLDESDLVEVVATHYLEAYNNSTKDAAAEELATKARVALVEAVDRARSLGSHQQAMRLAENALGFTTIPLERGRLLYLAGSSAINAGAIEHAIVLLTEAVDLLHDDPDRTKVAHARTELAAGLFHSSRVEEAIPILQSGIDELEDPEREPAAGPLFAEIARMYAFTGRLEEAVRHADLAMIPAERNGDMEVIAQALITRGVQAMMAGRPHEAIAVMRGATQLAEEHDLIGVAMRAYTNISSNQMSIHPRLALETSQRGLEHARRYGLADGVAYVLTNNLAAAIELGRFAEARQALNEGLENEMTQDLGFLLLNERVRLEAYSGDVDAARALLEELRSHLRNSTSVQDRCSYLEAAATLALVEGHLDEVHALLEGATLAEISHTFVLVPTLGRAGVWHRDAALIERSLGFLAEYSSPNALTTAQRETIEAGLAAVRSSPEEATERYRRALKRWTTLEIPLQVALCQMDFALAVGGPEAAAEAEAAIGFFTGVGNQLLVDRIRESMEPD